MPPSVATEPNPVPLCVDLDGTVIRTDMLWESLKRLLRRNPLFALLVPLWFLRGRACLKGKVAIRTEVDIAALPYHESFVEFLRTERRAGRTLLLVSASDYRLVKQVADHLGLFIEVLASNGKLNLRGKSKAARLVEQFGEQGFDYAGNSSADLAVWPHARQGIIVGGSVNLAKRARRCAHITQVFD